MRHLGHHLLDPHYTYFLILALSLAGPLALSFDKKVAFYKKWKYVFPAMILPAVFYIGWDAWFTGADVWRFNADHISGIMVFHLPLEEVLFFFIVPYCCLFIYECIRCYFPSIPDRPATARFLQALGGLLFIVAVIYNDRAYTFYTFIFTALFIFLFFILRRYWVHFHVTIFLFAYAVTLFPFLVVNGYLTAIPVVSYNDAENLGIRLYTIPVEDVFYGMLLVMMNTVLYEKLRNRRAKQ
jgi:lycopene cyclase domain-containing protein